MNYNVVSMDGHLHPIRLTEENSGMPVRHSQSTDQKMASNPNSGSILIVSLG
jgi:hypothetical protein